MDKSTILDKAKDLINGARKNEYGTPKDNFSRIAAIWSIILGKTITPAQVALCMAGVKITRLIQTEDHPDSWIDLCGYSAIGGEVATEVKEPYSYCKADIKEGVKSISHWGIK